MSKIEITEEVRAKYFHGYRNKAIRTYFYLREGLNLLNDFKYLVAGILALYVVLKIESTLLLGVMFIVAIPILIVAGYYWVHRAKKSLDWFAIEFTTHFGKYGFELQEKQIELLEEINRKLDARKDV
jgi:hypothetical protein